jgi:hypothetical protein
MISVFKQIHADQNLRFSDPGHLRYSPIYNSISNDYYDYKLPKKRTSLTLPANRTLSPQQSARTQERLYGSERRYLTYRMLFIEQSPVKSHCNWDCSGYILYCFRISYKEMIHSSLWTFLEEYNRDGYRYISATSFAPMAR